MMKRKAQAFDLTSTDVDQFCAAASPHAPGSNQIDWTTIDDEGFQGFTIQSAPSRFRPNKKSKTIASPHASSSTYLDAPLSAWSMQTNPFPRANLSNVYYKIEPTVEWESARCYIKFAINGEEVEVGQFVYVKKAEEVEDSQQILQQWFAKILEIRAGDASHVYLRVYWVYRPEDISGGRQSHHGESELIVSNHMDVIEALSVEYVADVIHWNDDANKSDWPAEHQLFWRQSLDMNKPKNRQLSNLRKYCVDKRPCNPDKALVNCNGCKSWLHAHCLEERAVAQLSSGKDMLSSHKKSSKSSSNRPNNASARSTFQARFSTSAAGQSYLTINDQRKNRPNRHWNVDIDCPVCNKTIEKADQSPLQDPILVTPSAHELNAIPTIKFPPLAANEYKDSVMRNGPYTNDSLEPEPEVQVTSTSRSQERSRTPFGLADTKATDVEIARKLILSKNCATPAEEFTADAVSACAVADKTPIEVAVEPAVCNTSPTAEPSSRPKFRVGIRFMKNFFGSNG